MFAIGNHFKTRKEAEFQVERLKVLAEMKRIVAKDDEVAWDANKVHWFICYNIRKSEIDVQYYIFYKQDDIYFASEERAYECINTIGEERLKKYYFQVKE